jgi:dephospho-CoA kinase
MLKIGLTGGIGSGKTTVAKVFKQLGIPVYASDDRAKALMMEDVALRSALG